MKRSRAVHSGQNEIALPHLSHYFLPPQITKGRGGGEQQQQKSTKSSYLLLGLSSFKAEGGGDEIASGQAPLFCAWEGVKRPNRGFDCDCSHPWGCTLHDEWLQTCWRVRYKITVTLMAFGEQGCQEAVGKWRLYLQLNLWTFNS